MKKWNLFLVAVVFLISSCGRGEPHANIEKDRISFLSGYGITVDIQRPYYSSEGTIPLVFDTYWNMRNVFSKDGLKVELKRYEGEKCSIYMYPILKLPFDVKKESSVEERAVLICHKGDVICSYIEFISELRTLPPMSLKGKSLVELSGIDWNVWKDNMDSDDDKRLVIWQYYDALRISNFDEAYWYIYDKESIKKEDFIKAAMEESLPYIDFLDIQQYKEPTEGECYFLVKAMVGDSKIRKREYEITFDLKRNPEEKEYGGWKIYMTKIK